MKNSEFLDAIGLRSKNRRSVDDKFLTPHGFILLATCTTSTLLWILGKSLLKPKRANFYTKRRQSPWFKLIVYHLIFDSWSKLMSLIGGNLGVVVWRAKKYIKQSSSGSKLINESMLLSMSSLIPWTLTSQCAIGNIW